MPKTRRTVVIDWRDNDATDSDEMQIWASSDEEAKTEAKKRWRTQIGFEWPSCRITRCWILSPGSDVQF
jgi:hypothetical protein